MEENPKTLLHRTNDHLQANLLKAKLKEQEIDAVIINQETATMLPFSELTYDLYVPSVQLTKSRKVFMEFSKRNKVVDDRKGLDIRLLIFVFLAILIITLAVLTGMRYFKVLTLVGLFFGN